MCTTYRPYKVRARVRLALGTRLAWMSPMEYPRIHFHQVYTHATAPGYCDRFLNFMEREVFAVVRPGDGINTLERLPHGANFCTFVPNIWNVRWCFYYFLENKSHDSRLLDVLCIQTLDNQCRIKIYQIKNVRMKQSRTCLLMFQFSMWVGRQSDKKFRHTVRSVSYSYLNCYW